MVRTIAGVVWLLELLDIGASFAVIMAWRIAVRPRTTVAPVKINAATVGPLLDFALRELADR
jgi:hypothetical protein